MLWALIGLMVAAQVAHSQGPVPAGPGFYCPPAVQRLPQVEPPLALIADAASMPTGEPASRSLGDPQMPSTAAPVEGLSAEEFLAHPQPEVEPEPEIKLWKGSFELGLDGTQGNSEVFNFRFGVDAKRETDADVLNVDLDYHKTTSQSTETANRAFLDWRCERRFQQRPWTYFVHGTVDYDEFQAFDCRVTVDLGIGHELIKNERTSFAARMGSGVSREIGGPDGSYVPEAVFGLDFEHEFSDRHKISAAADYTPDMTAMNDFRLKSRASWEMVIDREMNLSLKLSVLDRYDSTPNGVRPNDLDYSAVLLWKL